MTITEAAKIAPNTLEFETAVDALSDAAERGDKEAGKVLLFMLNRNNDFVMGAAYGRR